MPEIRTTKNVKAADVRRGDRIWASDDGDWLLVDRIDNDGDYVTFYRADRSEAEFRPDHSVLVAYPGSGNADA